VVYTIVVSNSGPSTAVGQTVTDSDLTALAGWVGDTWTAVASSGSSVATASGSGNISDLVTLLPGGTATFTVTTLLHPAASATGTTGNTATVTLPNGDTTPADNTSTDTLTLTPQADLAVTKSVSNAAPVVGQTVTFTLIAVNNGPSTATDVTVSDPLPAGLSFVSATPGQGPYDPGSGTWLIGTLPVGGTAALQLTALTTVFGPVVNGATVRADQFDPNMSNNEATAALTVLQSAATVSKSAFLSETNAPGGLGWLPVAGDWQGGDAGIGAFDPATGAWYLRNEDSAGAPDGGQFVYGGAGWLPVAGDWSGSGDTGIGAFDPATATWYLRNELSPGAPDAGQFAFGGAGWLPVAGDWSGSGHAGIGAFDPATATWYLRNEDSAGAPDAGVFRYGVAGGIPVVGDWTRTGHLGIGVFDPATGTWYLRSSPSAGAPDVGVFQFGGAGWWPVAGDWAGAGHAGIGAYDPGTAAWYLRGEASAGAPDGGAFAFGGAGRLQVAGVFPAAQHLDAAGGEGPGADPLGQDQLQAAVAGALARLAAAGADPGLLGSLASASYGVAALPPGVLGLTDVAARRVMVSADAAGHGWFADGTPLADEEFAPGSPGSPLVALPGSPAAGKEDLLTAVLHEMGHLAGSPDGGTGLMAGALAPGARDLGALDQVFAASGGLAL
jgi:uncharacterized repeat protein (TIGR01451 family)